MSGDHNMNQTSAAWRKRQIALDKKAENARELGLDYDVHSCSPFCTQPLCVAVREAVLAERKACAKAVEGLFDDPNDSILELIIETILSRSNT
jgi:hypothetical protein